MVGSRSKWQEVPEAAPWYVALAHGQRLTSNFLKHIFNLSGHCCHIRCPIAFIRTARRVSFRVESTSRIFVAVAVAVVVAEAVAIAVKCICNCNCNSL